METVVEQTRKPASACRMRDTKQRQKSTNSNKIDTAFKQQRLKAWQPILTPKTVIPTYFVIGLIFIPIGIGLFIASDRVRRNWMSF
jgi:hypothetical protein